MLWGVFLANYTNQSSNQKWLIKRVYINGIMTSERNILLYLNILCQVTYLIFLKKKNPKKQLRSKKQLSNNWEMLSQGSLIVGNRYWCHKPQFNEDYSKAKENVIEALEEYMSKSDFVSFLQITKIKINYKNVTERRKNIK